MSTKHFTANVISASKVVPDGPYTNSSANGVWSISEAYDLRRGGRWPGTIQGAFEDRILFAGGSSKNEIDYKSSTTGGNFSDFGDLLASNNGPRGGASSSVRMVFATVNTSGGDSGRPTYMQYVAPATTGNAQDFGTLSPGRISNAGASSETRGIFAGGAITNGRTNSIVYITIASTGGGSDFGDLTNSRAASGGCGSPTRALFGGGNDGSSALNVIDYVTIASTGNAIDFGNLSVARQPAGGSSETRALFAGGSGFANLNVIDYVEISTLGNATDFGNLAAEVQENAGSSNKTYAIFGGGSESGNTDRVNRRLIASGSNASDFGNLTVARTELAAACSTHGGIAS